MLGDGQLDPIAIDGDDVNEILIGSRRRSKVHREKHPLSPGKVGQS